MGSKVGGHSIDFLAKRKKGLEAPDLFIDIFSFVSLIWLASIGGDSYFSSIFPTSFLDLPTGLTVDSNPFMFFMPDIPERLTDVYAAFL